MAAPFRAKTAVSAAVARTTEPFSGLRNPSCRRCAWHVEKNKVVDRPGCAAWRGGRWKDAPAVTRGPCHVTARGRRGRTSGGNPNFRSAPAAPRRVPGLAAMRKLNWDLLQLRKGGRDGSHGTRRERSYALAQIADTLHESGIKGLRATGLGRKRVVALEREWKRPGRSIGTMKNGPCTNATSCARKGRTTRRRLGMDSTTRWFASASTTAENRPT